jgi:hypothetical protein
MLAAYSLPTCRHGIWVVNTPISVYCFSVECWIVWQEHLNCRERVSVLKSLPQPPDAEFELIVPLGCLDGLIDLLPQKHEEVNVDGPSTVDCLVLL